MAMQDNLQLVRNFYEAVNNRDLDRAVNLFTTDAEFLAQSTLEKYRGLPEIRKMISEWTEALPDMRWDIRSLLSSGDNVVCELVMVGTHKGTLRTSEGSVPATGRKVNVPSCDVINFKNGKISQFHCYFEGSIFMQQLGIQTFKAAA